MKNKTALKQSIGSVKFLAVVVAVMIFVSIRYPSKYTLIPLVVFSIYFLGDVYNIYYIRRKAAQDRTYLDKRIN